MLGVVAHQRFHCISIRHVHQNHPAIITPHSTGATGFSNTTGQLYRLDETLRRSRHHADMAQQSVVFTQSGFRVAVSFKRGLQGVGAGGKILPQGLIFAMDLAHGFNTFAGR